MKCPSCPDSDLVMTERQGVEIDYCPRCRGVWLDRGELDKIIERANQWETQRDNMPRHGDPVTHNQPGSRHGHPPERSRRDDSGGDYQKRRKPFWMEIFD